MVCSLAECIWLTMVVPRDPKFRMGLDILLGIEGRREDFSWEEGKNACSFRLIFFSGMTSYMSADSRSNTTLKHESPTRLLDVVDSNHLTPSPVDIHKWLYNIFQHSALDHWQNKQRYTVFSKVEKSPDSRPTWKQSAENLEFWGLEQDEY